MSLLWSARQNENYMNDKPIGASPCMYEKYIDVVMDNVIMILNFNV